MKSIKNLIIASALSMMAAGCYAGSLVPNTSTSVSANVSFLDNYKHSLLQWLA